jgi:hypothetical protein
LSTLSRLRNTDLNRLKYPLDQSLAIDRSTSKLGIG